MSLTTKVKVAKFSFLNEKSYNKQLLTLISVDIRPYLPLPNGLGELSLFRVD